MANDKLVKSIVLPVASALSFLLFSSSLYATMIAQSQNPVDETLLDTENNTGNNKKTGENSKDNTAGEDTEKEEPVIEPDVFEMNAGRMLAWRLQKGDRIEIRKQSEQKIKINKNPVQRYVYHRIFLDVAEKDPRLGYKMQGVFRSQFRYENEQKMPYKEEEAYESEFYIHPLGKYDVEGRRYMPNVRSIPSFHDTRDPAFESPDKLTSGDTWLKTASEYMNLGTLLKIPLKVKYEYRGSESVNTTAGIKDLHKLVVNFQINREFTSHERLNGAPRKMFGFASAVFFWDPSEGMPYYSKENYSVLMVFDSGSTQEYKIKSRTYYKKIKPVSTDENEKLASSLKAVIKDLPSNKDATVSQDENRQEIRIDLPDVLFEFDSAELTDDSEEVLDKLMSVLKKHKRHILVRGHTDNTGDSRYNQKLSEQRAKSVVEYMVSEHDLPAERTSYEGKGSSMPKADNSTKEGRRKNRRVELVIR